jgi:hypothetical protein
MIIKIEIKKPRNLIAKDLRTPKYRQRVVESRKRYNRKVDKQSFTKELYAK